MENKELLKLLSPKPFPLYPVFYWRNTIKIILLIGVFILCSGGVHADTLKLVGDDTVQKDDAAVKTGDDIVQEKGIEVDKHHAVKDGDTLWDLAMKYYLNPFKWGIIYNANVDIIDNPDLIYPAEEIRIPGLTEKIEPKISEEEIMKRLEYSKKLLLKNRYYAKYVYSHKNKPIGLYFVKKG